MEPEEYFYSIRVFTDTASIHTKFTIAEDERKIYLYNKPSAIKSGYLYYASIHPKANKSLAFTSGGTVQINQGDTITGHNSSATMVVDFVRVTSGSWAGGNAVGTIIGTVTGTFQSENLDDGSNLNVATIAADATTADNFVHLLGEKFDDCIIEGVSWRCDALLANKSREDRLLVRDKESSFEKLLSATAGVKGRRADLRSGYRGY
jgi:hypothetical protein